MSFKCRLTNVVFTREEDVKTDVYLFGNFDNWLTFYSETLKQVKDANFKDFARYFTYETKFLNHLELKKFKLSLYQPIFLLYSTLIGSCEIDLYTLATGPKDYKISCFSIDGKKVGTLEFKFYFRCYSDVKIQYENVLFKFHPEYEPKQDNENEDYFFYYCGSNPKDFETTEEFDKLAFLGSPNDKKEMRQNKLFWPKGLKVLTSFLDWIDLTNEIIVMRLDKGLVDNYESEANGVGYLYLINFLTGAKNNEGTFDIPFYFVKKGEEHRERYEVGRITGSLKISNEPIYCQMKYGLYEDGKVSKIQHFWEGFPQPKSK